MDARGTEPPPQYREHSVVWLYNFRRPHQSLDGLAPADRFFGAAPAVLETLKAKVHANALDLARNGVPRAPFYLTGQVGDKPFSVHAEGERVFMITEDGQRKEVELSPPAQPPAEMPTPVCAQGIVSTELADEVEPPPGVSPLDEGLQKLAGAFDPPAGHEPRQAEPGGAL